MIHRKDLSRNKPSVIEILNAKKGFLLVSVLFGVPSRSCAGHGICKIASPTTQEKNFTEACCCQKAFAFISIESSREIAFHFVKKTISDKAMEYQFADDQFVVSEAFELPKYIWNDETPKQIEAGVYSVQHSAYHLTVIFNKQNDEHHYTN